MVEAEEVENGGVEIVHGGDVFFCLPAEGVGGAVGVAALDARAGKPSGEALGVMVAAAGAFLEGGHSTKLSAPNNQRIFK